jgi:hypothetical protein
MCVRTVLHPCRLRHDWRYVPLRSPSVGGPVHRGKMASSGTGGARVRTEDAGLPQGRPGIVADLPPQPKVLEAG